MRWLYRQFRKRITWLLYIPLLTYLILVVTYPQPDVALIVMPIGLPYFPSGILYLMGLRGGGEVIGFINLFFIVVMYSAYIAFVYKLPDLDEVLLKRVSLFFVACVVLAAVGCSNLLTNVRM